MSEGGDDFLEHGLHLSAGADVGFDGEDVVAARSLQRSDFGDGLFDGWREIRCSSS
jgi:hypothetical protein